MDAVDEVPLMDEQSESSEDNREQLKSTVYSIYNGDYQLTKAAWVW